MNKEQCITLKGIASTLFIIGVVLLFFGVVGGDDFCEELATAGDSRFEQECK